VNRILGQDDAIAIIRRALRSGRLHHAWIFSGPAGVGKFTTAIELARILLDPQAGPNLHGDVESPPDSHVSRLVDAGSHPDLHVIYKELALYSDNPALRQRKLMNIPLDLLRERMLGGKTGDDRYHEAPAYRTAVEGHRKVFIIDEAELIDATGQNALLKTLEEPPADTYIVLVTSRPERLLPTIRSRAQHVRFRLLDEASMRTWLERAELEVGEEEARWIEQFSDGSPGTAALAAEYGFFRWQQAIGPMLQLLAEGRYPAALGETLAALADEFATTWVKNNTNASKDAANKAAARHLLRLLASHARRELAARCADGDDPSSWLAAIALLQDAEQSLEANVSLKHVFENLVVQWARGDAVIV
jgi:DNA polymerase-3 subunit delta'